MFNEYPKWIDVDGPGHPDNPGKVLVNNEDEERDAKANGTGPAALNPPPNAGQKSLDDMDRDELKEVLMREGIPDDMSDSDIRDAIKHGRERRAQYAREDAEKAEEDREAREAGGDHGDGEQTDQAPSGDPEPGKDAEGKAIAPDPATEANAGNAAQRLGTVASPQPRAEPGNDARPKEAREKQADDHPAGNITEHAATPPKHKRGASEKPGKA